MKNLYKIGSFLLASAVLCFFPAIGQTISNTYQNTSVQHKFPNKWYNIRTNSGMSQASKDMDTFDDETPSFKNTYTGTAIQAAHTYIDTLYVKKGDEVKLFLPTVPGGENDGRSSTRAYQRWYNFVTEGAFHYSYYNGWYQTSGDLVSFGKSCYRFANGYVGGVDIGLTNKNILDYAEFHYPTDEEYNNWKISNGVAENK